MVISGFALLPFVGIFRMPMQAVLLHSVSNEPQTLGHSLQKGPGATDALREQGPENLHMVSQQAVYLMRLMSHLEVLSSIMMLTV